jgi:hypothetical protein
MDSRSTVLHLLVEISLGRLRSPEIGRSGIPGIRQTRFGELDVGEIVAGTGPGEEAR